MAVSGRLAHSGGLDADTAAVCALLDPSMHAWGFDLLS